MFGSEVLDAAAIGAGAALLGGIVAGIFSLITTWMNNKSSREQKIRERRLEAFKEIDIMVNRILLEYTNYSLLMEKI